MMKTIFQECIEIVKNLAGNDYLYFDTAVEVKITPHTYPFNECSYVLHLCPVFRRGFIR